MTTTQPRKLIAGDVLQEGDLIQDVPGPKSGCYLTGQTHESSAVPQPTHIASHTIGRTILGADLLTARYFRP